MSDWIEEHLLLQDKLIPVYYYYNKIIFPVISLKKRQNCTFFAIPISLDLTLALGNISRALDYGEFVCVCVLEVEKSPQFLISFFFALLFSELILGLAKCIFSTHMSIIHIRHNKKHPTILSLVKEKKLRLNQKARL